jgi:hypothetical protein
VSVKRALQQCCQQLRTHLQKRNALRDQKERKSKLTKYIPDVSRSLFDLLNGMRKRRAEAEDSAVAASTSPRKRPHNDNDLFHQRQQQQIESVMERLQSGDITSNSIKKSLEDAVDLQHDLEEQEEAKNIKRKEGIPLFLKPLFDFDNAEHDIEHPLFTFRPINQVSP